MRLRIFDFACRWFWIVAFYQRVYGEPRLKVMLFTGRDHHDRWFQWAYLWRWEEIPSRQGEADGNADDR